VRCDICGNTLNPVPLDSADHCHNPSPVRADMCLGCWMASVQLETFLYRATKHGPMGDWSTGWLKAIIADPGKFL
jgi:hypothetical protein